MTTRPTGPLDHLPPHVRTSPYLRVGWRPNVAAVIRRPFDGRILWCERADFADSWQLPQGGIDRGETPEEALWRELAEELGLLAPRTVLRIARQLSEPIRYDYPLPMLERWIERGRKTWLGQAQHFFLLDFVGDDPGVFTLEPPPGVRREFARVAWDTPPSRLERVADFKRDAIKRGFIALGLMSPGT